MFLRKMLTIAAIAVALQVNPVFADCTSGGCGSSYSECGDSCAPSFWDCDPCTGWDFQADWIYWVTRRCSLDYAMTGTHIVYDGKVKNVDPGYESGFRLGLVKECRDFDFGAHYTYYRVSESDVSKDTSNGDLIRTRINGQTSNTFNGLIEYAKGDYDLDYDLIDLEAGYRVELTDCLHGRLFGGLRLTFIDQDFDILYARDADDIKGSNNPVDIVNQSCDMDAYGLFFGAKTSYLLNDCFTLFGSFSTGLSLAEFDRKFVSKSTSGGNDNFTTDINVKDDCWKLVSNIDLVLGVDYQLCSSSCIDWAVSFGYEFHQWFNTSDFLTPARTASEFFDDVYLNHHNENLGFDGLFVRLSASF